MWPRVELSEETLRRLLEPKLPPDDSEVSLRSLALSDLYLACACVSGNVLAIELLDQHYLAKLPTLLKLSAVQLDEVCQKVRIHLLVGLDGAQPHLKGYSGRGRLMNYIKVIASRMALPRAGAQEQETWQEIVLEELESIPSPRPSPELEFGRRRDRFAFNQCLRTSFDALPEEHQDLLRMNYIEGISTTALAVVFGVNQSTISRRIKDVRRELYEKTKRCLQDKLGLTSEEFRSLLSSIRSQLEFGGDSSEDEDPPPEE